MDSAKKMKIGFNKAIVAAVLLTASATAYAMPTTVIVGALLTFGAYATAGVAAAFVVGIVASAVVAKSFVTQMQPNSANDQPNPGNRQQVPPATDNKLPVVYGSAWLGGTIVDLSITSNNKDIYFVMAICEVTNNGSDTITFGDVYWGGKKCVFDSTDQYKVNSLIDESTGDEDTGVKGKLDIYLYSNGSYSPVNSTTNAITVMSNSGLVYKWDNNKLMTNCAFAIIHLKYSTSAGTTGLQQTKFNVVNSRYAPGDCFYDYLTNTGYGAAVSSSQVDTTSLTELNTYCAESFAYTTSGGLPATQARFRFDGIVDTNRSVMDNLQGMASSCDCLIRYNEIESKWGVIVQKPTYTVAMDLDDSNMVSSIQITPLDIASTYNIIECKFPDESNQDAFNTATFDLAQIEPSLLFPNEPTNKQSVSLAFVNNDVRAQYVATRFLKAAREDLQIQVQVNYSGIQLEAGDIVTVTSENYGWDAKLFRILKVTENFASDGSITANLVLYEFNASVYDDASITQFQPAPNTGIANPLVFGTIPAPSVGATYPTDANPLFMVNITASSAGIIQYAELWYSAFSSPTTSQLIFAGTTEIQSNGEPYSPGEALPAISLSSIPAGTWYFFTRMVNSLATSAYSSASTAFVWKPTTFQYSERYLDVAYADNATGTSNFTFDPTNRSYYGLSNVTTPTLSTNPANYTWYLGDPTFGTNKYLCYANRTGRKFSFATGFANYAAGTGAFVPTQATIFDPRIWGALPKGTNTIDLDYATGQVIQTGTTTVGTGEIAVANNPDGKIVASLKPYLDFGSGVYSQTVTGVAQLTIDIYGRVIGFETPDPFYMTIQSFTATSGQTVFSVTRSAGYISGQCLVFQNGLLQSTADYTDTAGSTGTVTFATGRTAGVIITIISFKSTNSSGTPYASFTRNTATLTNATSYTPSGFTIQSGYELLFLNGAVLTDQDYDIVGGDVTNMPSLATGELTVIQWTANNLTTPNGDPVNILINTIIGQTTYAFGYTASAFNLYENGVLLLQGTDYTTASGGYTLANTPTTDATYLLQQTFARTGAV